MAAGVRENNLANSGMACLFRSVALGFVALICAANTHGAVLVTPKFIKLVRGPYLQLETPTSIVIRWRTDQHCEGFLVYGTNTFDMKNVAWTRGSFADHVVLVKDLV